MEAQKREFERQLDQRCRERRMGQVLSGMREMARDAKNANTIIAYFRRKRDVTTKEVVFDALWEFGAFTGRMELFKVRALFIHWVGWHRLKKRAHDVLERFKKHTLCILF